MGWFHPHRGSRARVLFTYVADLPVHLTGDLADRLTRALDREGKIARALEALGPIVARDVFIVDNAAGARARELEAAGALVVSVDGTLETLSPGSVDAIVSYWSAFRGPSEAAVADADRALRPDGRLLVVHDYGRDDVSRIRGDLPEYGSWSKRDGWYLKNGFKMRVIHAFWTFETLEEMRTFLGEAFGEIGTAVGETLKRPRLSYNVAIYHRTRGDTGESPPAKVEPSGHH